MSSPCIECGEVVEMERHTDGHFYKDCGNCRHIGGPYVSDQNGRDDGGQASLTDF